MVPTPIFSSEQQRDEIYDKLKARATDRTEKDIEEVYAQCNPDGQKQCDKKVAEMKEARDKEIAELEEKRLSARISNPALSLNLGEHANRKRDPRAERLHSLPGAVFIADGAPDKMTFRLLHNAASLRRSLT